MLSVCLVVMCFVVSLFDKLQTMTAFNHSTKQYNHQMTRPSVDYRPLRYSVHSSKVSKVFSLGMRIGMI